LQLGPQLEKAQMELENHKIFLGLCKELVEVNEKICRLRPSDKAIRKTVKTETEYFRHNAKRMHYAEFRSRGLFVGSGVVEAGCRTVIGQRLKLSGMHWTVKGANAIIALRCCQMSDRWEEFWESRAIG
jgi:hypothetical protein